MNISFKETGDKDKPSIVFIHGGGISGWMWEKQLEYFRNYHCIVPDLPEHGKSVDVEPLSISDSANRIADLIESVAHDKKAHVVGHSLGAKVLVELLATRPDVVDHAVVASALFRPVPFMKMTHKMFVYKFTAWLMHFKSVVSLSVKLFQFPDASYAENAKGDFQSYTPERLYRIYDELYQNLKLPEGLAGVRVPTLVIAGEKEPKAMRESVLDVVNSMPNARGVLIKEAKHTYPWAMYETFNKLVGVWLKNEKIDDDSVRTA